MVFRRAKIKVGRHFVIYKILRCYKSEIERVAPWKKGWAQIKQKFVAFHTQVPAPSTSSSTSLKVKRKTLKPCGICIKFKFCVFSFYIFRVMTPEDEKKVSLIHTHIEWVTDPPRQIDIRTNVPNELSTHFPSFFFGPRVLFLMGCA